MAELLCKVVKFSFLKAIILRITYSIDIPNIILHVLSKIAHVCFWKN